MKSVIIAGDSSVLGVPSPPSRSWSWSGRSSTRPGRDRSRSNDHCRRCRSCRRYGTRSPGTVAVIPQAAERLVDVEAGHRWQLRRLASCGSVPSAVISQAAERGRNIFRNIFPEYFLTNDKRGNIRPYVTLAASKSRARRWPDRRTFRMADRTANARECSQSLTFSIAGRCAGPAVQRRSVYAAPGLRPDARKLFAADR